MAMATGKTRGRKLIFSSADVLDRFSLRSPPPNSDSPPLPSPTVGLYHHLPGTAPKFDSHLSLLAMVDCWARLRLNP